MKQRFKILWRKTMRKRTIACLCLMVFLVAAVFTAVPQKAAPAADTNSAAAVSETVDAMDKILESGKLVVATELGTPPFAFKDPKTGEIDGLAIELARMFADDLGVELEIRTFEWSGIFPSLLTRPG